MGASAAEPTVQLMHVMFRLPHLAAVLLLAAPCIGAETPFTDPVPPAVIGRPLEQIRPAQPVRPVRPKPVAIQPERPRQAAAGNKAPRKPPPARTAAAAPANAPSPRAAKQAVDDRVDARSRPASEVGKGSRLATKPLDEGAYIGSKHQALVRQYYASQPASTRKAAKWKIGEPLPRKAVLAEVPDDLRAKLPVVPPGHRYVQLDGEVVLLAVQSRMVVDGVSRNGR